MLDKLKKHLDSVFSSVSQEEKSKEKQKIDNNYLIETQLSKNNVKQTQQFNNGLIQELKRKKTEDNFYEIKKISKNPNKVEQNKLNQFIQRDQKLKYFKLISYNLVNKIILIKEAIDFEEKILKKPKVIITTKHLKQVGLLDEKEPIPDILEEEDEDYLQEQKRHLNRFVNPMARSMQENISQQIKNKRKQEEKIDLAAKIKEKRIYSDKESSIYQNEINKFLKENDDYFQKISQEKKPEKKSEFEDDFFDDLLDFDDED